MRIRRTRDSRRFRAASTSTPPSVDLGLEAAIEMEGDAVVAVRDRIAADRGDEPRDVHRAAGAEMPCPALARAAAFQRIGVEIMRRPRATTRSARHCRARAPSRRRSARRDRDAASAAPRRPARPKRRSRHRRFRWAGRKVSVKPSFDSWGRARPSRTSAWSVTSRHSASQARCEPFVAKLERRGRPLPKYMYMRAHGVADDLGLLAHRHVRLVVFVGLGPVFRRDRRRAPAPLDVK